MAKEQKSSNGANLGFEAKLFLTADKLRDELLANPDVDVDEKIDELVKRFRFTFDDAAGDLHPSLRGPCGLDD